MNVRTSVGGSTANDCGDVLLVRANGGPKDSSRTGNAVESRLSEASQGRACGATSLRAAKGAAYSSICLPQKDILCVIPIVRETLITALDANPAIRPAIAGYLSLLGGTGQALDERGQRRLALQTLDIIGLLLNTATTRDAVAAFDASAARQKRIERYVIENLTDTDLSIGKVAAHLGYHPKQVQRVLAAGGRTFADLVLEERLQLAKRKLVASDATSEKISTIAFDVGFGDLAYFNRAFRARFGHTPSGYRSIPDAA